MSETSPDEGHVERCLEDVLDPCSCFTEEPINIVDLGLVEDITVTDDTVQVELLLTSPGCTYLPYIERAIEERVQEFPNIQSVDVVHLTDEIWTRDRMNERVRADRREQFESRMRAEGITPYHKREEPQG